MRFAPSFPLSLLAVSLLSHSAIAQQTNEIERIETTSSRIQGNMNASGYAVSSISEETLSLLSFQHIQESLNYIAGAGVQRGNGQEYLPALRSPVLTGAGACGGILAAEDGIALRAAGFCNINELFEAHGEIAHDSSRANSRDLCFLRNKACSELQFACLHSVIASSLLGIF
ncbi:MAG: hypothetical protein AAF370_12515, partial [Pseudomonadota bacterium]